MIDSKIPRYQYDSVLQERRSLKYMLRLLFSSASFADFYWALATIGLIGVILIMSAIFTQGVE